jgi:hypothetical protein
VVLGYFSFLDISLSWAVTVAVAALPQRQTFYPSRDELSIIRTASLYWLAKFVELLFGRCRKWFLGCANSHAVRGNAAQNSIGNALDASRSAIAADVLNYARPS